MKKIKSHFKFNKQERSGIFFLLLTIVALQVGYFVFRSFSKEKSPDSFSADAQMQAQIEVLKYNVLRKDSVKMYPFNPNFITDYKGYALGLSVKEIDRLHAFRATHNYVNTPEEFQRVTQVSDSLLQIITPLFKFPEWKNSRNKSVANKKKSLQKNAVSVIQKEVLKDLNAATAADLRKIYGIGEKLSERILKFRNRLGGFLVKEQLYDVYALEPDVVERVFQKFKVFNKPEIHKININSASVSEISSLAYITYTVAQKIVVHREANGVFFSLNELKDIPDFPAEKIDRIALYLSL